ncbi:plasma membrane calcium-transporting ATPase 3-like [Teleopsis dalmanni]|uniref:plasma membrane calcium-transporting ATPase 3-like n=1 Tax=Teleopsis dalmanni TaxID=139649 RepID=UPI0018CE66A2|nr:plasma membrane calcium-transporting ATPase 3-like [Teleopsis dalmanni]
MTSSFGITPNELKDLMDLRNKEESITNIQALGGSKGLCKKLRTPPDTGLSGTSSDLEERHQVFGSNFIPAKPSKSFLILVWEALQDITLIILQVAALVSLFLSFYTAPDADDLDDDDDDDTEERYEWIESLAIFFSVFIVVLITALNDYFKEKQFRSLQDRIKGEQTFMILRNAVVSAIPNDQIVVGDIAYVKYGDTLPADGVLIYSHDLKVDESSMTGESDLVKKSIEIEPLMYAGTHIMEGSGKMVVTAVGLNSQAGVILSLLGVTKQEDAVTEKKGAAKKNDDNKRESHSKVAQSARSSKKTSKAAVPTEENVNETIKMESKKHQSVLQTKLTTLAIQISYFGTIAGVLTVILLITRFCIYEFINLSKPWRNKYIKYFVKFFIVGVTVLVVAVPEGLPLAVTLSLAYSVKKMMKDNNLVRHLDACETMGNATTICSDKTGTLTTNRMTVIQSFIANKLRKTTPLYVHIPPHIGSILTMSIAINTSYTSNVLIDYNSSKLPTQSGNKTECALLGFLLELDINYDEIRSEFPENKFIHVYTFNSARKVMATVIVRPDGGYRLFAKGASEIILNKCDFMFGEGGELRVLTNDKKFDITKNVIEVMATDGLRTVSIAYRDFVIEKKELNEEEINSQPDWSNEEFIIGNLTFVALMGIEDPVRPEVPEAIRVCQNAGITVRMVTGDNLNTARSIATKCGIIKPNDTFLVLDTKEFNKRIRDSKGVYSQKLFDTVWPRLRVLARSAPIDKYTLVKGIINSTINENQEVVAVTGDGTNDGPALKIADVGFAMGIAGTDVAKEASDIILTDDNFTSIVKAVLWGRNVYDSIAKFLQFQLTVNVVAVAVALVGACTIQDCPIKAVQMLWVNVIMDTLGSLALATEAPSNSLLQRKPYGRKKPLISLLMMRNIIGHAVYQLIVIFILLFQGASLFGIKSGITNNINSAPTKHFTIIFNAFVMMTLFNEINARKLHGERNVFEGLMFNPIFCSIWISSLFIQIIIVQCGKSAFSTQPLTIDEWLICFCLGLGSLIWGQIIHFFPIHLLSRKPTKETEPVAANKSETDGQYQLLWVRGVKRLQTQLRAANAFSENTSYNLNEQLQAHRSSKRLSEVDSDSEYKDLDDDE